MLQAASSSSVSTSLRFLPAARLPGGSSLQAGHLAGVLTLYLHVPGRIRSCRGPLSACAACDQR